MERVDSPRYEIIDSSNYDMHEKVSLLISID